MEQRVPSVVSSSRPPSAPTGHELSHSGHRAATPRIAPISEGYKLIYFNMKGVCEPVRMLLAMVGQEFEDIRVSPVEWPQLQEKCEYGQLPVLEVGGRQLSQPNAIMRYFAKKFNLLGTNEWEIAKNDELADLLTDFRNEWRRFFTEKDPARKDQLKRVILDVTAPKYMEKFENMKKKNRGKYINGENVCWIDLQLAHLFELFESTVGADIMDPYPRLQLLQRNVFDMPGIKGWIMRRPNTEY